MRFPKVSQREWLFLAGGLVAGYVIVPKILHHADIPGLSVANEKCPPGKYTGVSPDGSSQSPPCYCDVNDPPCEW